MYIEELYALQELKVCHNLLQCLPASIGNFENLKILDVSHNYLLYLPMNICYIRPHMDISNNSFLSINFHHTKFQHRIPTLVELSANIVLEYMFVSTFYLLVFICMLFLLIAKYSRN